EGAPIETSRKYKLRSQAVIYRNSVVDQEETLAIVPLEIGIVLECANRGTAEILKDLSGKAAITRFKRYCDHNEIAKVTIDKLLHASPHLIPGLPFLFRVGFSLLQQDQSCHGFANWLR